MSKVIRARKLRRDETEAERRLWARLRDRQLDGLKFRRQQPIGRYFADLVGLEIRLIVEVDGGQHAVEADKDRDRTAWLSQEGYRVIRFWNRDVLENFDGVLRELRRLAETERPLTFPSLTRWAPPSPPRGEGNRARQFSPLP